MLDKWFHLQENQTTIAREAFGGLTTFLTMSYIIFVQPVILSSTGMDFGAVMTATCLSSAFATILMGLLANYPIALAPAMGHNVFFAFVVCAQFGIPWQTALGAIFISGVLFIVLSMFNFRQMIMKSIPLSLKMAIAVGIGLMISLLGFQWAGVVVDNPATLVSIGKLNKPHIYVAGIGLIVSMLFTCLNIRGAILLGMLSSAAMAWVFGLVHFQGVFDTPPSLTPILFALRPLDALSEGLLTIIFVFFILDLFDTVGTLVGVAELGGFMRNGELPRANRALLSDAISTVFGSFMGTSTVTSYVESCAGISDGARTGLANIFTGSLFLLALFTAPVVKMLGQGIEVGENVYVYPVIAPALIMVGFMMMRGVKQIPWDDKTESIPAFLTIVLIGFSFSITEGIAFGFMSYTLLKVLTGRGRQLHPFIVVISVIFVIRYFVLSV